MREFYLNITYECNSNCIFCAAEHEITGQCGHMELEEVKSILNSYNLRMGDEVIINGGEPTLHKELNKIIEYIRSFGADVILFTNGRMFRNADFLESIYHHGLAQISIPIHGNEIAHDRITRVVGSYRQTIEGLQNIKKIKQKQSTVVELKTVICRSNLEVVAQTVGELINIGIADRILISSLFQTEVAKMNNELVNPEQIIPIVKKILDIIRKSEYGGNVILYGIPLCQLDDSDVEYLIQRMENKSRFVEPRLEEIYIDYKKRGESIRDIQINKCFLKCCKLQNYCERGDMDNFAMYRKRLSPFI